MHIRNAIGLCCLYADTQLYSIKSGGNGAIIRSNVSKIIYLLVSAFHYSKNNIVDMLCQDSHSAKLFS